MECIDVFQRLRQEELELEKTIDEARDSAESAQGGVREYRRQRLMRLLTVYHGLHQRMEALEQHAVNGMDKVLYEAEKLWSDFRNAVVSSKLGSTGA